MKQLRPFLAPLIFLIVLGVVAGTISTPAYKDCANEQRANASEDEENDAFYQTSTFFYCEGVYANENSGAITAIATLVIAAFTATLWIVNRAIADAANLSAKTAERALLSLERPYVILKEVSLNTSAWPPSAYVALHNYGRTPANIAEFACFLRVLDHMPTEDDRPRAEDGVTEGEFEVIMGQGEPWISPSFDCVERPIGDQANAISRGTLHYWCWGWVHYRDVFGETNPTYWCRRYNYARKEWEPVGGMDTNYSK